MSLLAHPPLSVRPPARKRAPGGAPRGVALFPGPRATRAARHGERVTVSSLYPSSPTIAGLSGQDPLGRDFLEPRAIQQSPASLVSSFSFSSFAPAR